MANREAPNEEDDAPGKAEAKAGLDPAEVVLAAAAAAAVAAAASFRLRASSRAWSSSRGERRACRGEGGGGEGKKRWGRWFGDS